MINLKPNIGGLDREIRLLSGALLTFTGCITKNKIIKTMGCALFTTGITKKCIFYDLLNINTNKSA